MIQTDRILEFDKIKDKWADLALTQWAKDQIRETVPCMSERELLARQRETTEARALLEKNGNPPLVSLDGIRECIQAAVRGECLSIPQLESVEAALVAVMRLKNYLNRSKQWEISLAYYEDNLDCVDSVKEMIGLQIRNGRVDDNASRDLKAFRDEIDRNERNMRDKADSVIRANKECMSDSFSTMRSGHLCIPVKRE